MKNLVLSTLIALGLLLGLADANAASYFWVGGAGTWDNSSTANWSASSGGGAGAGPPTSADSTTFDANSGSGTVTINATAATSALTAGKAGVTYSFGAGVTFGAVTVTAGTFVTGAFTHSFTSFTSITGTRTLTLDNSTLNITGTSGTLWNIAPTGTLTATLTGSAINFTVGAVGGSLTITTTATLVYPAITITGPGLWNINVGPTLIKNFSYTSTTNKTDSLTTAGITIQASGSLTLAGNSTVNRAFLKSTTFGTARALSVPSTATVTTTNVDFQDTTMTGTFSTGATASSIGDALGNTFGWSSVQPNVSATQTYAGGGGNWSTSGLWTSRVPLPQDDVVLPASLAGTLVADMPRMGRDITATNFDKTLSFNSVATTILGSVALGAGGTFNGSTTTTFAGRGAQTITSNGKAFSQAITISAFGGTYTLQDNFSVGTTNVLTLTNGTLVDGGFAVAAGSFVSTTTSTRAVSGSGTWSLAQTGGTLWNCATTTGLTVSAFTGTIKFTGGGSSTKTFAGGGLVYNANVWWSSTTASGILTITGANTFNDFKVDGTLARTVTLPASTVNTLRSLTQSNVTPDQRVTINSSTPATQATIQSTGRRQSLDWLTVTDINALGGAGWFAGDHSTSGGNNYGWQFHVPADVNLLDLLSVGMQ